MLCFEIEHLFVNPMFTYEDNKVELRNQSNPLRLAATISDTRTLLSCPTPSIPASPGVNIINILHEAFTRTDPKSAKKTDA